MKSPFPINGTGSGDGRWLLQQKVAAHAAGRLVAKSGDAEVLAHTKRGGRETAATPTRRAS